MIRAYVNGKGEGRDRHQVRSRAKSEEPGTAEGRWKWRERAKNVRQVARSLVSHRGKGPEGRLWGQGRLPEVGSKKPSNPRSSQER